MRSPDFQLSAKFLKPTLRVVKDQDEEVQFGLVFESCVSVEEAEKQLRAGATFLDEAMVVTFEGFGTGFLRTVRAAGLSRLAGAATEDADVRVTFELSTQAGLDEAFSHFSAFMTERGKVLAITGTLLQPRLALSEG